MYYITIQTLSIPCTHGSLHLRRDSLRLGHYFLSPKIFLSPRNVTVENVMTFYLAKILSPKIFLSTRNVTVENVMTFYLAKILAPKFWLSPRNVTLENVTTYFVRQMNRPTGVMHPTEPWPHKSNFEVFCYKILR